MMMYKELAKRRKSSKDDTGATGCCKRLSVFACVCAVSSLLVHTYNFFDDESFFKKGQDLDSRAKDLMKGILEEELQQKIEAYLSGGTDTTARVKREAMLKPSPVEANTVAPHVEFFNPKMRGELELKDDLEQRRTGQAGPAPGGDTWVWLTSYSRVPYKVVQGFCKATQDYCPPGVQGPKGPSGLPGPKGDRGEPGTPGSPGTAGRPGPIGPPGPRGEQGYPGNPGLDGRDGIPGEPGLDGMPGRNGADGAAGKDGRDGLPGKDGSPGKHGKDGKDGKPGAEGQTGPKGAKGPPGAQGPKGSRGSDGRDGAPGRPGITTWKYNNGSDFLVPPTFHHDSSQMIVEEGKHVRLTCIAAGKPEPTLEWRRPDGTAIVQGAWRDLATAGPALTLTNVSRRHTGKYVCLANNGVLPGASQTYDLQVYFSPYIRVANNVVYAFNRTATLECEVQAWPEPVWAWETTNDTLEPASDRHRTAMVPTEDPWRWILRLELDLLSQSDYNRDYFCVAKNELRNQTTKGKITLQKGDPSRKYSSSASGVMEWGVAPPPLTSYEELCHEQRCPPCARCDRSKLLITPMLNGTTTYRQRRYTNCQLYAIGKPVLHYDRDEAYGSWMRDSKPADGVPIERMWATSESDTKHLKQYETKSEFKVDRNAKVITLSIPMFGNGHIVYNGSFFYQANLTGQPGVMVRHDLAKERVETYTLSNAGGLLYAGAHNQLDFSADGNGLWAIYPIRDSNNTAVAKIHYDPGKSDSLGIDYIWNISLNHRQMGEMFIVCGVLYALDSASERETKVSVAIDLYQNRLLDVALHFTNPFRQTTLLSYDQRHKELYSCDKGNLLTYPVRYHDLSEP